METNFQKFQETLGIRTIIYFLQLPFLDFIIVRDNFLIALKLIFQGQEILLHMARIGTKRLGLSRL